MTQFETQTHFSYEEKIYATGEFYSGQSKHAGHVPFWAMGRYFEYIDGYISFDIFHTIKYHKHRDCLSKVQVF